MIQAKVYNFMGFRRYALALSVFLLLGAITSLSFQGLQLGLDFTGGTQVEVGYETPANVEKLRAQLESNGFEKPVVVHFGSDRDVLIRLQGKPEQGLSERVYEALQSSGETVELRRGKVLFDGIILNFVLRHFTKS